MIMKYYPANFREIKFNKKLTLANSQNLATVLVA